VTARHLKGDVKASLLAWSQGRDWDIDRGAALSSKELADCGHVDNLQFDYLMLEHLLRFLKSFAKSP
jgi:hypothetical protein